MPLISTLGAMSSRGFGEFAQQTTGAVYIEDVFSTWLYTGNGTTNNIVNGIDISGKGGLVWIKARASETYGGNVFVDTARGRASLIASSSVPTVNSDSAAYTSPANYDLVSFNSNGFTLGSDYWWNKNTNGQPYVSWTFREQSKFFDVVTYIGDGATSKTINHSLGSVPGFVIIKPVSASGNWIVSSRNTNTTYNYGMQLNSTGAQVGTWNPVGSGAFSSTYIDSYIGMNPSETNTNGVQYVAYLFAHNAGGFGADGSQNVISCGSYAGNSSSNPINLGWEPQFILIKNITSVSSWYVQDTMREMSLTNLRSLSPNTSSAEYNNSGPIVFPTATGFDFAAGGYTGWNQSGNNYIYMAIRRGPMRTPTSGTSVYSVETHSGVALNTKSTYTTNFPVDTVWQSQRPGGSARFLVTDRLRAQSGTTSSYSLQTASAAAENAINGFASLWFDNNTGFSVQDSNGSWNGTTTESAASWSFRRAPGFFDVICYSGTGALNPVAHNLGVVPELIINKSRSNSISWVVGVQSLGKDNYLLLDATAASGTVGNYWGTAWPTSTTITYTASGYGGVNASGYTYVSYLFASCPGVSKVGSYTGTSATQTINCGFTGGARFVLIKRTDNTGSWYLWDSARGMVAGTDPYLLLNSSAGEVNTNSVYTATGGFQIVSTALEINTSGGSYIYLAIA